MNDPTFENQKQLLTTDVGLPGSGRVRYGAAMYFYARGDMQADMLEIYRICSKLDREDPIQVARFEGVSVPSLALGTT